MNKRIFLIGYMGVGKTTLGKKIAKKLDFPFIDIDHEIEQKFSMSISDFFNIHGEARFREEETLVLNSVIEKKHFAIISVGGGLPCFNENMQLMNEFGLTCYLKRSARELYSRLKQSKKPRPLLEGKTDIELFNFISNSLKEREHFYEQAKIIVEREQQNVNNLIELFRTA